MNVWGVTNARMAPDDCQYALSNQDSYAEQRQAESVNSTVDGPSFTLRGDIPCHPIPHTAF